MLVRAQSLMVYPPLRPFSPVITGCIIPVLYSLFGTINKECSLFCINGNYNAFYACQSAIANGIPTSQAF